MLFDLVRPGGAGSTRRNLCDDGKYRRVKPALLGCLAGPGVGNPTHCDAADLNSDGDIDLEDFADFQAAFVGS